MVIFHSDVNLLQGKPCFQVWKKISVASERFGLVRFTFQVHQPQLQPEPQPQPQPQQQTQTNKNNKNSKSSKNNKNHKKHVRQPQTSQTTAAKDRKTNKKTTIVSVIFGVKCCKYRAKRQVEVPKCKIQRPCSKISQIPRKTRNQMSKTVETPRKMRDGTSNALQVARKNREKRKPKKSSKEFLKHFVR